MNHSYKYNQFATHQPLLIELLKNTSGNILECGCGEGSTRLIKQYLGKNRKLVSIESNKEWYDKYKHLEDDNHKLVYVNASNDDNDITGLKWTSFINENFSNTEFEIVFIDQSPWTARTHTLKYFINKAKYVVIHDVDYFPSAGKFGKIINVTRNGDKHKYDIDFSDISNKYYVFYPPFEHYTLPGGIPTLLCSNIASDEEFNNIVKTIKANYNIYY
jgi:hypothetical protein